MEIETDRAGAPSTPVSRAAETRCTLVLSFYLNATVCRLSVGWRHVFVLSLFGKSIFLRIRQTTNGALCLGSFWQPLKTLTNDSLIQRKTLGGEGETGKNNGLPWPRGAY